MTKKVAIIGGGPSAMFAMMACKDCGIRPDWWMSGMSNQAGAFWLHWLPPSWESLVEKVQIRVTFIGNRQNYIRKQWGNYDIPKSYSSSFPITEHMVEGYNPLKVQNAVDNSDNFEFCSFKSNMREGEILQLADKYDLVFHCFPTEKARAVNSDLITLLPVMIETAKHPFNPYTEYDGMFNSVISRRSSLWGWDFTEFLPVKRTDQFEFEDGQRGIVLTFIKDLVPFDRPVNFFPLGEKIIPIGRLARFDRKALSHDAYDLVRGYVENI